MGQVKFIQLGTNAEPKRDYAVDNVNQYRTDLASAIANHPGAVIFTTFIKSANSKPKNEIYANGQLYSAGGGSGAVYYGTVAVGADGQIEDFSLNHEGAEPEKGNVYIYDPTANSSGNIADCTAYYYNGGKWVAFTGNVNAENVWFPNGVQRTEIWGAATTKNSTVQDECVGYNLKALLENYLVQEVWPSVTSSQTSAPSFIAYDGEIEIPDNTPAEYLLVPNSGTNPTVKFTYTAKSSQQTSMGANSTENTHKVKSIISGMSYGYKTSLSGDYMSDTTFSSAEKSVTYTINEPPTKTIQVGKKVNNQISSATGEHGNSVTVTASNNTAEWTFTVPAKSLISNGTVTAISGGDYFDGWTATWKENGTTKVTSITPNSISNIYYCSNKKEVNESHKKGHTATLIQLPSSPTGTRSEKTYNYKVYQPIIWEYNGVPQIYTPNDGGNAKFYGARKTFKFQPKVALAPANRNLFALYIPSVCTSIPEFKVGSGTLSTTQYNVSSDTISKSVNGVSLPYKKITFTDAMEYSITEDGSISITIN